MIIFLLFAKSILNFHYFENLQIFHLFPIKKKINSKVYLETDVCNRLQNLLQRKFKTNKMQLNIPIRVSDFIMFFQQNTFICTSKKEMQFCKLSYSVSELVAKRRNNYLLADHMH